MNYSFKLALLGSVVALSLGACGDDKKELKTAATAPVTAAANTVASAANTAATAVANTATTVAAAVVKDKNGCIAYPKNEWMNETDAKAKVAELGYKAKTFEVTGNCYEIYGFDKDGKKAEVYFDAKTMAIVKKGD
ncbi:MAG: PepSY domain-containing protein [Burkholderiales bacterium]|nr:PepSY domain-containing protein [Burkholderiales bacterium]